MGESFPELAEYPFSQGRPHSPNCIATVLCFFGPPSYDEILLALQKLKDNKAGGIDGLNPELFYRGAPSVCQPLQALFALIWLHKKILDAWNIAVVIPCNEKRDKAKCSNYRGISLIAIALKVFEAVVKKRLEPDHTKAALINQAGFKKVVGCRDQVCTLCQLLEQRYQFSRWTVLIFIDFKLAFWTILSNRGLDSIIIKIPRTMHKKNNQQSTPEQQP